MIVRKTVNVRWWVVILAATLHSSFIFAQFADTVEKVKPSIVGVGSYSVTQQPARRLLGTGFVVADGNHMITNWHVIDQVIGDDKAMLSVFVGRGANADVLSARLIAKNVEHDLALLRFDGPKQPALKLALKKVVREGEEYGFTGFPIGEVMGLFPVTHKGMISAITPVMIPRAKANQLSAADLKKLRDPLKVYQLDGTAYPGNSGSPLYDMKSGQVIGVINKVLIKESKEKVLSKPSGISFAIPVRYVKQLLDKAQLSVH